MGPLRSLGGIWVWLSFGFLFWVWLRTCFLLMFLVRLRICFLLESWVWLGGWISGPRCERLHLKIRHLEGAVSAETKEVSVCVGPTSGSLDNMVQCDRIMVYRTDNDVNEE